MNVELWKCQSFGDFNFLWMKTSECDQDDYNLAKSKTQNEIKNHKKHQFYDEENKSIINFLHLQE
jgi:hypothetical protein